MKTILISGALLLLLTISCVPQRKYLETQSQLEQSQQKNKELDAQVADLSQQVTELSQALAQAQKNVNGLERDTALQGENNRKLRSLYDQVNGAYEDLLDKIKESETRSSLRTQELASSLQDARRQLDEKQEAILKRESELRDLQLRLTQRDNLLKEREAELQKSVNKLKGDLQSKEQRVNELQNVLLQKDSANRALRNVLNDALLGFKDKGLSVNIHNGKVYVSVEEKLLFQSGKYNINSDGKQALLKLAEVLKTQSDVDIVVEGHTDNVPLKSSGPISDNWDLSVKRATEVVKLLTDAGSVKEERITAAGRADTQPIAPNTSAEGRAKNRRTEIILTPKLNQLYNILDEAGR